ncbi:hypothetical protein [Streptomyces sp. TRM49041]|uniref:hypothetical protein n=1 Tax=Streptomyces sp. TRM49041 TaxID=2603216 RepID=UPI0016568A05|nr:hypothetical protein [Streptomyces sp. TRM49041]
MAWTDGLVRHETPDTADGVGTSLVREFRPGPPVRALHCHGQSLLIATDELTATLAPA